MADKPVRLLTPEAMGDTVVEVMLESVPVWLNHGYRMIEEEDYSPNLELDDQGKAFAEEVEAWHNSHDYSGNPVENPPEPPVTPLRLAEEQLARAAARPRKVVQPAEPPAEVPDQNSE